MLRRLSAFSALITLVLVSVPKNVAAATAAACDQSSGGFLSFPTWYKYLEPSFVNGSCEINFQFPDDILSVLLAVFEILLRVGALAAIGYIIYGGILFILSQGEPDKVKGSRTTILNAVIGLIIMTLATAIVNLIARSIG